MNHSLLTADHPTHLKVVGVALIAAIVVASLGICARTPSHPLLGASSRSHAARLASIGASDIIR